MIRSEKKKKVHRKNEKGAKTKKRAPIQKDQGSLTWCRWWDSNPSSNGAKPTDNRPFPKRKVQFQVQFYFHFEFSQYTSSATILDRFLVTDLIFL